MRTVDVGAGENPHPDADLTIDQRPVADRQGDLTGEWPLATASADRIIARHVLEHLADPTHAFREAARVLRGGGVFEIVVPLGHDAVSDPDHETVWTWKTPICYCQERQRPWDPDVPFVLEGRELSGLRFAPPLSWATPLLKHLGSVAPTWAAYRCFDGELQARYRRREDDR